MSSDEDDYMSDKFLQNAEKDAPAVPILRRNADKRALEILKRKKEIEEKLKQKRKSMKVVEQEKREEGLSSAISSDNKGFAMLAKMGYKPGQGIGKTEGMSEPISITIRDAKSGLGKETQLKEYREKVKKLQEEFNPTDFRNRLATKKLDQLAKRDLQKSQNVCQQLDIENNLEVPREVWFWPKKVDKEKTGDSSDEEERLEKEREMEEEKERDRARKKEAGEKEEEEEDEDEEEISEEKIHEVEQAEDEDEVPVIEKLEKLTLYLRNEYKYCVWCGVKYESDDDIKNNCPGDNRNDH